MTEITRRALIGVGAAALAAAAQPAFAQAKPKLRLSLTFPETDLRAEGYKAFAAAMKDDFDVDFGGTTPKSWGLFEKRP